MDELLLSIIVPFKNTGKRILNSINSVKDLVGFAEIIYVDNGSNDDTLSILVEANAKLGDSFIVLSEPKFGVSAARNCGLRNARGKYILFLDSDDLIDRSIEFKLKSLANYNYDCILFSVDVIDDNGSVIKKHKFSNESNFGGVDILTKFVSGKIYANVESVLHNRVYLQKLNLIFNENLSVGEDIDFNMMSFRCAKNCFITNDIKSYYVKHAASTSAKEPNLSFDGLVLCYDNVLKSDLDNYTQNLILRKQAEIFCKCIGRSIYIRDEQFLDIYLKHFVTNTSKYIDFRHMGFVYIFFYFLVAKNLFISKLTLNGIKLVYKFKQTLKL